MAAIDQRAERAGGSNMRWCKSAGSWLQLVCCALALFPVFIVARVIPAQETEHVLKESSRLRAMNNTNLVDKLISASKENQINYDHNLDELSMAEQQAMQIFSSSYPQRQAPAAAAAVTAASLLQDEMKKNLDMRDSLKDVHAAEESRRIHDDEVQNLMERKILDNFFSTDYVDPGANTDPVDPSQRSRSPSARPRPPPATLRP